MQQSINRKGIMRTVLMALAMLALQACAQVNHLRDAQSTFNETAALENQLALTRQDTLGDGMGRAEGETQVRAGYGAVLASLDEAEKDQAATLKKYQLYGNMLMLRAMTYWRLHNTAAAEAAANAARELPSDQIFPRDRALAIAMPGLIRNSQAYAIIRAKPKETTGMDHDAMTAANKQTIAEVSGLIASANEKYDEAIKTLAANHALRVYLFEAKLATYKNLFDAYSAFPPETLIPQTTRSKMRSAWDNLKASMCRVADLKPGAYLPTPEIGRLLNWSNSLALRVSDVKC
jgi:hypothetical protein